MITSNKMTNVEILKDENPNYPILVKERKNNHLPQVENYLDISENTYKKSEFTQNPFKKNKEKKVDEFEEFKMNQQNQKREVMIDAPTTNVPENIILSRRSRFWFFILILSINFTVNLENGTIPAATDKIQQELKCSETELGTFGTMLHIGNLVGNLLI
jgi:hypothetical protein